MSVSYRSFGPFPGGLPDGEGLHIGQFVTGQRFLTTDRQGLPLRPRFRAGNKDRYVSSGGHAFDRREFS